MSSVYVGGASRELERVERFIARVKAAGHTITFDWTVGVRMALWMPRQRHESPMAASNRAAIWSDCINGVSEAAVCVVLAPASAETRGMWAEIGVRHACGGEAIYVGHDDDSIATSMMTVVADDDAAFAALSGVS